MTNEDKNDCLTVLKEMKDLCRIFSEHKNDQAITAFIYAMNECVDVLTEIIENKPHKIERMF